MAGFDLYSQSMDRNKKEENNRGSIMDVISLLTMGSGSAGKAATEAGKQGAKLALKQTAVEAAKQGAKGAATQGLKVAGSSAVKAGLTKSLGDIAKNQVKSEGLGTLVNNVITPSGSSVRKPPAEFTRWLTEGESKGSFLGGLKKGALGEAPSGTDTSPWFKAGTILPSIMRSKLGLETSFDTARAKIGDPQDPSQATSLDKKSIFAAKVAQARAAGYSEDEIYAYLTGGN